VRNDQSVTAEISNKVIPMPRPKLCKAKDCRSTGDKRILHADGFCRNCYMRRWRQQQKSTPTDAAVSEPVDDTPMSASKGAAVIAEYLDRRVAERRRKVVRALMDDGHDLDGILEALITNDGWRTAFIDTSGSPLVLIRRDLAFFDAEDAGKSQTLREAEATIRIIQRKLADPNVPATPAARLTKQLAEAQVLRARLAREVTAVTGVGVLPATEGMEDFAEDEEEDAGHETDKYDWHVYVVAPGDDLSDGTRRRITWVDGFDPGEPDRPTPEEPYMLPNVEWHNLPHGLTHDEAGTVMDENGIVVGRYRFEEGEEYTGNIILNFDDEELSE
jgi:hypothetical protein